jgi:Holliday junction DNA helicase RuvA
MFSSLEGIISRKQGEWVEVNVGGVGYKVFVSPSFHARTVVGEKRLVAIHTVVSQDDIRLFGFAGFEELALFELLIGVSGVGPKTAVQIVGSYPVFEISRALGNADVAFFEKIKGVGKKTAQRIIVDLKSKVGGDGELDLAGNGESEPELVSGLKQLGFAKAEIEAVLPHMPSDVVRLEDQLQWCLRNLRK